MQTRATSLLLILGVVPFLTTDAQAGSSSGGEEFLSVTEAVEPNVLFLVDLSSNMSNPCSSATSAGPGGGGTSEEVDATSPCIDVVMDVIEVMSQHYDWARYGVIGTTEGEHDNTYYPIAPLGSSYAEISAAVSGVSAWSTDTRNLAEALSTVAEDYLKRMASADDIDEDGDGFTKDWDESGIEYHCQDTHIIVITADRPYYDNGVPGPYKPDIESDGYTDIKCDASGLSSSDVECFYDQSVYELTSGDLRSDLTGTQNVYVHTLGINTDADSVAESLFDNASSLTSGQGVYTTVTGDRDEMISAVINIMSDIRSGTYSRSAPVMSADGNYLVYSFYELTGEDPLAQGHIRAYEIENDPESEDYGQVLYESTNCEEEGYDCDGALWDGGDLLVSRIVTSSENNEEDRDGIGRRDIYTFMEDAVNDLSSESNSDKRQGFDLDFVTNVGSNDSVLSLILDTTPDTADPSCAADASYDLNDDCKVDDQDLQALVDFARGLPEAEFRYLNRERGTWKLGDSPNAVPVVVQADEPIYTRDSSYDKFLDELVENGYPDIVMQPANDGMLHAFRLEEDESTSDTEQGEELWAWIPGYLLYREHDAAWAGRLIDLMLYGRTFLFDGSPVVEDVWIDFDGDGAKGCNSVPDDCEWRRIVVVQQGKGGPTTLALDITDPTTPTFLWEQTDETDASAMGYTVGGPLVGMVLDNSGSETKDYYVAMWGSGRAVPYSSDADYYQSTEGNVYMWAVGDDYWGTSDVGYQDSSNAGHARGDSWHPQADVYGATLSNTIDSDDQYEYAYVSAALTGVDGDSDGDLDTLYFPITAAYKPLEEGGGGPGDVSDPGSTWMYKACINTDDPGDLTWTEFFDPMTDGKLSYRPEVYYAATASWLTDGSLGLYWGSGTPYARTGNEKGYFFAVKDTDPMQCDSDTMKPITDCGAQGVVALDSGEGLTSAPLAYAGVVYFSTWVPAADRCDGGEGRLYGLRYDDCSPGLDTNNDGDADTTDKDYIAREDVYISGATVTNQGRIAIAGSDTDVEILDTVTNPYMGTTTIAWREVF